MSSLTPRSRLQVHFSILDWDKLSSNDHIGDASFDVKELLDSAPQPDSSTGLYGKEAEESGEMKVRFISF
jgi:phosphatidylserine decarboxylase